MSHSRTIPGRRRSRSALRLTLLLALLALLLVACPKTQAVDQPRGEPVPTASSVATRVDAAPPPQEAPLEPRPIGPYQAPFDGKRNVYYVVPKSRKTPQRLLANLHGVCNPPGYACGYWTETASNHGFLVCPEGNSRCGPNGPPTWDQPLAKFDVDLEKAIAVVLEHYPEEITRDGAILTGFSLGATASVQVARIHPGRWPYLILVEANPPLGEADLRKAGVRGVAMIAGELGAMAAGEKATVAALKKQGFKARYWAMKGAGHHYSADIDAIMGEAIAWLIEEEHDPATR